MTYDEAVANNVKWRDMYLSLLASWTALCDMAGVEGDSSPDEVHAALAADPPALPLHPDDGHEHRFGCCLCGVDAAPRRRRTVHHAYDPGPRCRVCGMFQINVVHEMDPDHAPEGRAYYDENVPDRHPFVPSAIGHEP